MAPINEEAEQFPYFDDREEIKREFNKSVIQEFFNGSRVFITGGTGFMGQVLIEKLLRSCPGIDTLYMLIRPKKGKEVEQRHAELFEGALFERLKKERPKALSKVVLITGDVSQPDLGLSEEHKALILRETSVVFHGAATVRFDEKIRTAVAINVSGTKRLLDLAKQMPNLKAFVHISTAYANCPILDIEEKFYEPGADGDKLEDLCTNLSDDQLEILLPTLLGKWPNTYTYTKAVSEDCIRRSGQGLPIAVIRPSIVINTAHEPIVGWINNVYGAAGVTIGAGVGILKTIHCNPDSLAEIVPVDMAINCCIAAAWDIGQTRLDQEVTETPEPVPIYNFVSSVQRPITWSEYTTYTEVGLETPSVRSISYYCFTLNRHRFVHNIYVLFLHLIPAIIVDTLARVMGKKPVLWAIYQKVNKLTDTMAYFSSRPWTFSDGNVQRLWRRLPADDQQLFHFKMADLDWRLMMKHAIRGMRIHVVKEPMDNLPEALRRYRKLKIAHYTIVSIVVGLLLLSLYWFVSLFI